MVLDFYIPRGTNGKDGTNGSTPIVSIGEVTTGDPGTNAQVTDVGTSPNVVLNFTIPKGEKGNDGTPGQPGTSCTHEWDGTNLRITSASGTSSANLKGDPGKDGTNGIDGTDGKDGISPTISIGTVNTVEAGNNAQVTNSGTLTDVILNFSIPRGADGRDGVNGIDGTDGRDGTNGKDGTNGINGKSAYIDIAFSSNSNPDLPSGHYPNYENSWDSTPTDTTLWMAIDINADGVWQGWRKVKIKGNNGTDG